MRGVSYYFYILIINYFYFFFQALSFFILLSIDIISFIILIKIFKKILDIIFYLFNMISNKVNSLLIITNKKGNI